MNVNSIGNFSVSKNNYVAFGNNIGPQLSYEANALGDRVTLAKVAKPLSAIEKFAYKALMGLGFIGVGTGFMSCKDRNPPVIPPVVQPATFSETEKGFIELSKELMVTSLADGEMLDSSLVKNTKTQDYTGWKVNKGKTTKDTIDVTQSIINKDKKILGTLHRRFFKAADGTMKSKLYDSKGSYLYLTEYPKRGQYRIEIPNGVERYKYLRDGATVAMESIVDASKSTLENAFCKGIKHL